jgi:hypothetical protein
MVFRTSALKARARESLEERKIWQRKLNESSEKKRKVQEVRDTRRV